MNDYLKEYGFISVSVVTYYEILNGLYFRNAKAKLETFELLISLNQTLPLTKEVAKKAAQIYAKLRKEGQPIGHNNTLIAATAIVNGCVLITYNTKHFSRIEELEIDNWVIEE